VFLADRTTLVLGGPGCGKTTRLLGIVEAELAAGVRPHQIAFVSFTKAAAKVAVDRAAAAFGLDQREDLPWFRTIHSLAYASIGLSREEVMDKRDWAEFGTLVGEKITGTYESDSPILSGTRGDQLLRICDLAATTLRPVEAAWRELDEPFSWHEVKRFAAALDQYKHDAGKLDFNDMLKATIASDRALDIVVAVIDEAQDLTPAQWQLVSRTFRKAERVYVGGDDDQAIYKWAGADVERFLSLPGSREVLPLSHRLPRAIHGVAMGIAQRITHRFRKDFAASERAGVVERHNSLDSVKLDGGSWLLLARNGYMLAQLEELAREQGVHYRTRSRVAVDPEHVRAIQLWEGLRSGKRRELGAGEVRILLKALGMPARLLRETHQYTPLELGLTTRAIWHEAFAGIPLSQREYYIACLRRGEKLTKEPRVRIETIHAVKGEEAENVLVMSDMSGRTYRGYSASPDHEHRVFYVGVTRARESLHLLYPQTDQSYAL
jgi:superfamily I DNA/RNA helicase